MADDWTKVAQEKELKEGIPVAVTLDEKKIMLVRIKGKIHACGNECSHYGAPLTDGLLLDHVVTCPWHNARFDVTTAKMVSAPGLNDLPSYETKVKDGEVYVRPTGSAAIAMPEGQDRRTFLIIGAGASGNAAAEMLRREGFAGRIVMVTGEPDRPYDRTMLSKDFLSGEAPAKWLPLRGEKFYNRLQIELLTNHVVQSLDPGTLSVAFEDGSRLKGDGLLLATGGIPRKPDIAGAQLNGCFTLRSLQDCQAVISSCEQAQRAVILGASFLGLEVAASLRSRDLEIHVAAPERVPLAPVFGERVGMRMQRIHEENGVCFHLGQTVQEIRGRGDGKVREVILADESRLKADLLILAVGVRPAVDYLSGTGLVKNGGVPVDSFLETEKEGIYACGDIAMVPDRLTGEMRRVEHWVEAQRQGQHAARSMLGKKNPYENIPFFWSRQFGQSLKYIGYAPKFQKVVFRGKVDDASFLAGYYEDGSLKAVAGIGKAKEFIALGQMLQQGRGITTQQFEDTELDLLEMLR
jgi:NADPH-dependent 2,4-dienoyl-CoA reductase/sulfur reductase-like enzyme/nitrite reductase/ring-hydroxylating ferredoxin subunit